MRVARLHGVGDVRVADEPVPVVAPDESLVRVTAVGLCGSDLHWYARAGIGDAVLKQPLVVGHEFAGVIEGGQRDGVRVAVDPAISCETCRECRGGHPNLCSSVAFAGHGARDGGLREYLAWPTRLLHPLPDALADADGAMLEPLGVAIHALDLAHLRVGMSVGVFGCGPLGLLLIQAVRASGATAVVATDPLPHRREAALRYGADHAWEPGDPAIAGADVDVSFEVAGTDAAVDSALLATRPGGRAVLLGIPDDDSTTFRASVARRKGLTILLVRRMKAVYPRAIDLVRHGLVDVSSVVTARYPLERAADAFASAAVREGLKIIVEPSPSLTMPS